MPNFAGGWTLGNNAQDRKKNIPANQPPPQTLLLLRYYFFLRNMDNVSPGSNRLRQTSVSSSSPHYIVICEFVRYAILLY